MAFPPKVWTGAMRRIEAKLPEFTYEAWIAPLAIGPSAGDRLVVLCPSTFHRDRVRNSFQSLISDAFADELGRHVAVDFDVCEDLVPIAHQKRPASSAAAMGSSSQPVARPMSRLPPTSTTARPQAPAYPSPGTEAPTAAAPAKTTGMPGPLADEMTAAAAQLGMQASGLARPSASGTPRSSTPRGTSMRRAGSSQARVAQQELPYSFGNFVVGPCNSLAREAAFALAGEQLLPLKQLYLAAGTGLGKTHLARAVAVELARRSGRRVRYASAEAFNNEFVAALRSKQTAEFKQRYRPGDGLLVLEDVQFLAAKRATQLEFFHSVQHVIDAGGRVVLTGDRIPSEMPELDERVRDQLARGFVAQLEAPDATVRRNILKMKASRGGVGLPDDCLDRLVELVQGNVRELEGVLMQVVTTSTLLKRPIDLELTERAVAQKVRPAEPTAQRLEIADVVGVVASFFQTSSEQMAARSRRRAVLLPRQLAMYLCHRHTDAPMAEIGRALGRDHPSVRNAIRKIEREILESARLRYQVEALTTRLQERANETGPTARPMR